MVAQALVPEFVNCMVGYSMANMYVWDMGFASVLPGTSGRDGTGHDGTGHDGTVKDETRGETKQTRGERRRDKFWYAGVCGGNDERWKRLALGG